MNNISYAKEGISPVECTNYKLGYWRIRWDFRPVEEDEFISFKEHQFDHKPTMDEVRSVVTADSDRTDQEWDEFGRLLEGDDNIAKTEEYDAE